MNVPKRPDIDVSPLPRCSAVPSLAHNDQGFLASVPRLPRYSSSDLSSPPPTPELKPGPIVTALNSPLILPQSPSELSSPPSSPARRIEEFEPTLPSRSDDAPPEKHVKTGRYLFLSHSLSSRSEHYRQTDNPIEGKGGQSCGGQEGLFNFEDTLEGYCSTKERRV